MAFARSSVGQVSATRVAPVSHSPPIPNPNTKRKLASMTIELERPQANEHTE